MRIIEVDFITEALYEAGRKISLSPAAWRLIAILALASPRAFTQEELVATHGGDIVRAQRDAVEASPLLRDLLPESMASATTISLPLSSPLHRIETPLTRLQDVARRLTEGDEGEEEQRALISVLVEGADTLLPDLPEPWIQEARRRAARLRNDAILFSCGVDPRDAQDLANEMVAGIVSAQRRNYLGWASNDVGRVLIGRHYELNRLRELILSSKLLTLIGKGGVGKTALASRLMEELPAELADRKRWAVDLRNVSSREQLLDRLFTLGKIGVSLGMLDSGTDPEMLIRGALADGILFLDNSEGLDEEAVSVINRIAEKGSSKIVATSRRSLGAAAEQVFMVTPFPVPARADIARFTTITELAREFAAVALFLDLQVVKERFAPDELCRALERTGGLPLHIALAARETSRQGASTVDDLLKRLSERQTQVLMLLAMFSSAFLQEDAEALGIELLELETLCETNLIHGMPPNLYRLSSAVREEVLNRLERHHLCGELTERYATYVEQEAPRQARLLSDATQVIRQMLRTDQQSRATQMVVSLIPIAHAGGRLLEVEGALLEVRNTGLTDVIERAQVADGLGRVLLAIGRPLDAMRELQAALPVWREYGPPRNVARAASNLGIAQMQLNHHIKAEESLSLALSGFRALKETSAVGSVLANLGYIHLEMRDGKKALAVFKEAEKIARRVSPQVIPLQMLGAAEAYLLLGQADQALQLVQKSLACCTVEEHPSQRVRALAIWGLAAGPELIASNCYKLAAEWHRQRGSKLNLCLPLRKQIKLDQELKIFGTIDGEIEDYIIKILSINL